MNRLSVSPISARVVSLRIASDQSPYLGPTFIESLAEAVDGLKADDALQAVIIEGGSNCFSLGINPELPKDVGAAVSRSMCAEVPRLILSLPVPTIAVMAGDATDAGLILGLWCDIQLFAEEGLYGASPPALECVPGATAGLLEEMLGAALARELVLSGRLCRGCELRSAGGPISHSIFPRAEMRRRAITIATDIADNYKQAVVLLKQTFSKRRLATLEGALTGEKAVQRFPGSEPGLEESGALWSVNPHR